MKKISVKKQKNSPLFNQVKNLIESAKTRVASSVNAELALLNWKVGQTIKTEILQNKKAEYGKIVIANLADELTLEFGNGWSEKHLRHCLRSAEIFSEKQILYAVRREMNWTNIRTIAYEEDALKRMFYLEMAIAEKWTTRTLQDKMNSMLFERTAISRKPKNLIKKELKKLSQKKVLSPDLVFKNTYVLDFLGLKNTYSEKDLESIII